jgi:hypothetical protein
MLNGREGRLFGVFRLLQSLVDAWEQRRRMRQMPTTLRLWVPTKRSIRPETDADYTPTLRKSGKPPLPIGVEAILLDP